jgi:S1-C subfamily serine protease
VTERAARRGHTRRRGREPTWRSTVAATAVVAAALGGCVPPPPPLPPSSPVAALEELDLPEVAAASVARRAQEVTVRIRTLGCDRLGLGSGFALPGGVVVTNRHVVEEPRQVTVNTWDGRSLDADVVGIAVDSDLAILQLASDVDLPAAELRETPVAPGETVLAVGYPDGGPATVSAGTVVSLVEGELLGEPADVIRVDTDIRQGNSGGPLLDDQGRVVGVVFALDLGSGDGLVVPVRTLLERLEGRTLSPPETDC